MLRREIVLRAIKFKNSPRIPIWFHNRDHTSGDIMRFKLCMIDDNDMSEWGYHWKKLNDGTMGQPQEAIIKNKNDLKDYIFPKLDINKRLEGLEEFKKETGDRYLLAGLGITGFNTYTFIRGFENAMVDFATQDADFMGLLSGIFSFENKLIELAKRQGFDGVHFEDDWGTQEGLIISPEMWRKIFKPHYQQQIQYAHELGLCVWFHSCGNITSIVPDFYEIGVDVMNISQPNVVDVARIGADYKGKQCFMTPISYQTVSISGTPQEIKNEAARLYGLLGTQKGGFIGYVEDYSCMGMSEENFQACVTGFRELSHL